MKMSIGMNSNSVFLETEMGESTKDLLVGKKFIALKDSNNRIQLQEYISDTPAKGHKAVVSNVDQDGQFEIIIYDDKHEKLFQTKVDKFDIDLVPGTIASAG
jgi:hypothetical protein